jgi:hypothetical protein
MCVCMYECTTYDVFMYVCMYACMHMHAYMYVSMHVCVYVSMHAFMYVCMNICKHVCHEGDGVWTFAVCGGDRRVVMISCVNRHRGCNDYAFGMNSEKRLMCVDCHSCAYTQPHEHVNQLDISHNMLIGVHPSVCMLNICLACTDMCRMYLCMSYACIFSLQMWYVT